MTPVKATIRSTAGGAKLTCAFNPNEYTISKSAKWRGTPKPGAPNAPKPEFVGTKPRNLKMKLLFDAWASGQYAVTTAVDQLLSGATRPRRRSPGHAEPADPRVHVGTERVLRRLPAVRRRAVHDVLAGGTPLRATVNVTLVEIPDEPAGQNPTSGSLAGHRTAHHGRRRLAPFDRIPRIRQRSALARSGRRERHRRPAARRPRHNSSYPTPRARGRAVVARSCSVLCQCRNRLPGRQDQRQRRCRCPSTTCSSGWSSIDHLRLPAMFELTLRDPHDPQLPEWGARGDRREAR